MDAAGLAFEEARSPLAHSRASGRHKNAPDTRPMAGAGSRARVRCRLS